MEGAEKAPPRSLRAPGNASRGKQLELHGLQGFLGSRRFVRFQGPAAGFPVEPETPHPLAQS